MHFKLPRNQQLLRPSGIPNPKKTDHNIETGLMYYRLSPHLSMSKKDFPKTKSTVYRKQLVTTEWNQSKYFKSSVGQSPSLSVLPVTN